MELFQQIKFVYRASLIATYNYALVNNNQLAHDVVTTLGFGCILLATLDNVVTTLPQRCVSDVVTTTKN